MNSLVKLNRLVSKEGGEIGRLPFADDFVGVTKSEGKLQELINVVRAYCRNWTLKVNVLF